MDSRLTALMGRSGVKVSSKTGKGLMVTDNSVVIADGREVGGGGRGYKGDKW